jgi:hypothetical protein
MGWMLLGMGEGKWGGQFRLLGKGGNLGEPVRGKFEVARQLRCWMGNFGDGEENRHFWKR